MGSKIWMRTIPKKTASCCALALTPVSPTTPIARPADKRSKLIV